MCLILRPFWEVVSPLCVTFPGRVLSSDTSLNRETIIALQEYLKVRIDRDPKAPLLVRTTRVFAPESVSLEQVVRAAGSRWQVEEAFELARTTGWVG